MALASLLAAIRVQGREARLHEQRYVIVGAGSAGLGVAQSLYDAMLQEGYEPAEAQQRIWVVDQNGLLGPGRDRASQSAVAAFFTRASADGFAAPAPAGVDATPAPAAHGAGLADGAPLLEVVRRVRPTILLGLTGVGGTFTEPVVREMAAHVRRPIVFPLSNPTTCAECTAEQAYTWSDGRAVVASGSPFEPVLYKGHTLTPSQTNNMYIFPGLGLGATAVGARKITDRMLFAAAKALSELVTEEQLAAGRILPPVADIRKVAARVAAAVAASGIADGIVTNVPPAGDLVSYMAKKMYDPVYEPLVVRD